MEKTVFKDQNFHALLLTVLGIFFCWNLYNLIFAKSYSSIIPLLIQGIVLAFVLTRDKGAKLAIKVWAVILIVGSILSILGKTVKMIGSDDIISEIGPALLQIVFLVIGLAIYHYNDTTVVVEIVEKDKTTPPKS